MTSRSISVVLGVASASLLVLQVRMASQTVTMPQDPGPRAGAGAGEHLPGLSASQIAYFEAGKEDFDESEDVADGLGPRMNLDSCLGCHSQPASGGSSPATN